MDKLVSIIMPSFNSSGYIAHSINSVLKQTYENWELLITDDCSTDNTVEIVEKMQVQDKRIKLYKLSENGGPAKSRNHSIGQAKGDLIAFLDSDDMWFDEKLDIQVRQMQETGCHLTFTSFKEINEDGAEIGSRVKAKSKVSLNDLYKCNYITCSTAMYDASQIGKIYMPDIRKRQDYGLWHKIVKKNGPATGIDMDLALYRIRKNSVSSGKLELIKYQWQLYREIFGLSFYSSLKSFFLWIFYALSGRRKKGI